MKKKSETPKRSIPVVLENLDGLLNQLRTLIVQARQQALRAVDVIQVRTYWKMGWHIVEFEQGGAERAQYGAKLLPRLAERLTAAFGKGFDASNLRYMRLFYQAFPNCDALRHELSWTHYRLLPRVEDRWARESYMAEAAAQNGGTRALERQIGTLYYERLLDKEALGAMKPLCTLRYSAIHVDKHHMIYRLDAVNARGPWLS